MSRWSKAKKKVSYWKEMLYSRWSQYGLFGSIALGGLLAIPYNFGVGVLPFLGYLGGITIASLFVPGSSWFRKKVDTRLRHKRRDAARQHFLKEISRRGLFGSRYWSLYERLLMRRNALRELAQQTETAFNEDDIERLDDATVDFLGLWVSRVTMQESAASMPLANLEDKLRHLKHELEASEVPGDQQRLRAAMRDVQKLADRRREMATRDSAAEAAMLSLSDTFDELYQRSVASPTSRTDFDERLQQAVDQLNYEEELDYTLAEDVDGYLDGEFDDEALEMEI